MRVAFVGYMCSGKSFWASKVAAELGLDFVDLDSVLETEYLHDSIANFIKEKGEIKFRKLEKQALLALSEGNQPLILATGGGTPCYYENMKVLNDSFFTIYLNTSIKTIVSRLTLEMHTRPMVAHLKEEELQEFVAKHLFERRAFYAEAKAVLNENHINIESILKILPK